MIKEINHTIAALLFLALLSCKKQSYNDVYLNASLNVINAAPDIQSLNVNFTETAPPYYLYQQRVSYGANWEWTLHAGDNPINIIASTDTVNPIYLQNVHFDAGSMHSLYILTGSSKDNILLLTDSVLPQFQDSSVAVRFINLIPDSHPIVVTMSGNDISQPEFSAIGYKQQTQFKSYSCGPDIGGSYNFDIYDKASGEIIANFSWTYALFKSNTIVLSGFQDPASPYPINVFQVNNF